MKGWADMGFFVIENIKRAFKNIKFPAAVIGIAILECLDIFPVLMFSMQKEETGIVFHETVINLLMTGGGTTLYNLLTITLCALPCAGTYCDDSENHFITNIVSRKSYSGYSVASVSACAVSSFLCMVLGEFLFILILLCIVPVHYEDTSIYIGSWKTLEEGKYGLYILYMVLLRGMRGAFFAIISFVASAFIRNKFFIYAMPSIVYYFLLYILTDISVWTGWDILRRFNIANVYFTFQLGLDRELESLGLTLLYTIVTGILGWLIFDRRIRRLA